ncbi:MAG: RNA pseudouridine synthase [Firmicutes bacterium HGW-Firmicutes-1]|jgi:23S rRNA pseudouridine1911/1915/1917 synthase|nr:MAG: RNA pseudouridine synthase [Firmicutes bacterium HGW-Firmicutes-1]
MKTLKLTVDENAVNARIDKYLSEQLTEYTRSYLQKLITDEAVQVNEKIVKANYKLRLNDEITLSIPDLVPLDVTAQDMDLNIVYEDSDLLIINKPQDMVVHPAPGHAEDTVVNAVLYHCKDELSGINGVSRPGIVHRIDKNTSGLLVICKNDKAHVHIAEQLKDHTITRKYEAIVYSNMKEDEGTINAPIGRHTGNRQLMAINYKNGKTATTHYRVIERLKNQFTHVELTLETGRTHQIRVHMASIHHPLLGDDIYGPKNKKTPVKLVGQVLHAKTLGFIHPSTQAYVEFTSDLPDYFIELLNKLRN